MPSAKDILVQPISRADADKLVRAVHYSGRVVQNSQLHLGVFLNGRLEGAMQFGPSLDKRKTIGLVRDTPWNGFIELNRMAFSEALPRNSESRALGIAFRMMRKRYPHLQWCISFSDATQCGDGTIYRAAGFSLIGVKKNTSLWRNAAGETFCDLSTRTSNRAISRTSMPKGKPIAAGNGGASMARFREAGFAPIPGFQMRYIYFLDRAARERLTAPELQYGQIAEMGAGMYRGAARQK